MKTKLLTVNQTATLLGISTTAIYAAIARKRLRRRYRQGTLVVRESDVLAWDSTKKKSGRPQGKAMSDEHKARIAEAQKLRWARLKSAKLQQSEI